MKKNILPQGSMYLKTLLVLFLVLIVQCEAKTEIGDYIVDCSACNSVPVQGFSSYNCKIRCDVHGNVNENLTTLYDMVTEMAQELRTVSKSLEETKGKLNETEKELKDVTEELADVTEELRETKRQLNATEKKVNTEIVFSARLDGQMSYDTNDKVIFDYVITNVGNAYDNVAGIFTVPYNGSYELTLTTIGTGKTVTDITAPGDRLCQAYAKESNVIGMCTTRQNLVEGDEIWLQARANSAVVYNTFYNTFSGHLISLN